MAPAAASIGLSSSGHFLDGIRRTCERCRAPSSGSFSPVLLLTAWTVDFHHVMSMAENQVTPPAIEAPVQNSSRRPHNETAMTRTPPRLHSVDRKRSLHINTENVIVFKRYSHIISASTVNLNV
jgi:hypothetical protein